MQNWQNHNIELKLLIGLCNLRYFIFECNKIKLKRHVTYILNKMQFDINIVYCLYFKIIIIKAKQNKNKTRTRYAEIFAELKKL